MHGGDEAVDRPAGVPVQPVCTGTELCRDAWSLKSWANRAT
jgi:hypothetical protein